MTNVAESSIRRTANGIVFTVRVLPRASHPGFADFQKGVVKVRIAAPPVDGRANEACIQLLAQALGVKKAQVAILSGHTGRTKTVAVAGVSPEYLQACLTAKD